MKKIGLFGGGFDPVHEGHLALAAHALHQFSLQQVLFIPTAMPVHKQLHAPYADRAAMLEIALKPWSGFTLSLIEGERASPSYTLDTVKALHERLAPCDLFLLLGADAVCDLPSWYRYDQLLALVDLLVALRPGVDKSQLHQAISWLPGPYVKMHNRQWRREDGREILLIETPACATSSSTVRHLLHQGEKPSGLSPEVLEYILSRKLYHFSGASQ